MRKEPFTETLCIEGEIVAITTAQHEKFGNIIVIASNITNEDGEKEGRLTLLPHEKGKIFEIGNKCYPA